MDCPKCGQAMAFGHAGDRPDCQVVWMCEVCVAFVCEPCGDCAEPAHDPIYGFPYYTGEDANA